MVEMTVESICGGDVGRVVGYAVLTSTVANSSSDTTLMPASIDEATSLGRAASNTERAFCGAPSDCEADMIESPLKSRSGSWRCG